MWSDIPSLYVNMRFGRSSVLPTKLFLGSGQDGTTVKVNNDAIKIFSTHKNSWNTLPSYKEFNIFLEDDFIEVCTLTHLVSGVILHLLKYQHMHWNHQIWNSFSYNFIKPIELLCSSTIWKRFHKISSPPKCHDSWHRYQISFSYFLSFKPVLIISSRSWIP